MDNMMETDEITEIEIVPPCEHTIELENLDDGEIIQHTILIIRGNIKPMCGQKKSIYIQQLEIAPTLKTAIVQLSSRGDFRILIDCEHFASFRYPPTVNIAFKIKYCDAERVVNFVYKTQECIYRVQPIYIVCNNDDVQNTVKEKSKVDNKSDAQQQEVVNLDQEENGNDTTIDDIDAVIQDALNTIEQQQSTSAEPIADPIAEPIADPIADRIADDDEDSNSTYNYDEKTYENTLIRENALDIINLNMRLTQGIYAEVLRSAGMKRRTFRLNGECDVYYSELSCQKAWEMNEEELWQYFAKEILESRYGQDIRLKFVVFIGCTKYEGAKLFKSNDFSYANIKRHLKAHAALGVGGMALFGTAHFYAWPRYFGDIISCFSNEAKINQAIEPDESNYRRTYGGVYASTLGALCHEIGHIFDLGHTINGIMGSGLDYVNRLFTVDSLTELLPDRLIVKAAIEAPQKYDYEEVVRPRLTQIKRGPNGHLERYRQQSSRKQNLFYFTNSCLVILCYHPWFNTPDYKDQTTWRVGDPNIKFDAATCILTSEEPHSFKLIEIRSNINSLVTEFYEFRNLLGEPSVYGVNLPTKVHQLVVLTKTHHLFVVTTTGFMKKIY